MVIKIGIIGFGHLGKYLAKELDKLDAFSVQVIWNRSTDVDDVCKFLLMPLDNLTDGAVRGLNLVIEVAHPTVIKKYGESILRHCNLFIGSPTALADKTTSRIISDVAFSHSRSVFIPTGAFWGSEDVRKMANSDTLTGLTITMTKHPSSFRLEPPLKDINDQAARSGEKTVLYTGPVRQLCSLAPNNVNTMACAAIGAHTLGFDGVQAHLIADPGERDHHVVTIEVVGRNGFHCLTTRKNPSVVGKVTGSATYQSLLASIKAARDKPPGVHIC